jgi:hypothetical protein
VGMLKIGDDENCMRYKSRIASAITSSVIDDIFKKLSFFMLKINLIFP